MSTDQKRLRSTLALPCAARTIAATLTAGLVSAATAAQAAPESYDWGPPMMWGWGWSGMIFGPFFMLLVLILLIVAIVLTVRWFASPWPPPAHHGPTGRSALDILNERLARGEIDQAEYESKRRMILQS